MGRAPKALMRVGLVLGIGLVLVLTLRTWLLKAILEDLSVRFLGAESSVYVHHLHWTDALVDIEFPELQLHLRGVEVRWVPGGGWTQLLVQVRNTSPELSFKWGALTDFRLSIDTLTDGTQLRAATLNLAGSAGTLGTSQLRNPRLNLGVNPERLGFEFTATQDSKPLSLQYVGQIQKDSNSSIAKGPLTLGSPNLQLKGELSLQASADFEERSAVWSPKGFQFQNHSLRGWLGTAFSPTVQATQSGRAIQVRLVVPPYKAPLVEVHDPITLSISEPERQWVAELTLGKGRPVASGRAGWKGLSVNPGAIALRQSETGWTLEGNLGPLELGGWKAAGVSLEGERKQEKMHLTAVVPGVEKTGSSPLLLPVSLRTHWTGTYPNFEGQLEVLDLLSDPILTARGTANLATETAKMSLDQRWDLAEWDATNIVALPLKTTGGTMALSASLDWEKGKGNGRGKFTLSNGNLEWDGVPMRGLEIRATSPKLLSLSAVGPPIKIASLGSKLPVTDIEITWAKKQSVLRVLSLEGVFAEGKISVPQSFDVDTGVGDFQTVVHLDNLSLQALFEGAEVSHVSAKGTLSGTIPLRKQGDDILIQGASLKNVEPEGWLRYQNSGMFIADRVDYMDQFEDLLAQGQQALVFKALDNFYFTKMQVQMDRNPKDGLKAILSLAGRNPELGQGMPFEFNIGLSGQLEEAVKRSLIRAMMSPEAFAKRVQSLNLEQNSPE